MSYEYTEECQKKHVNVLDELRDAFDKRYGNQTSSECKLEEFEILKTLGVGGFGTVKLVKKKDGRFFAIKILEKIKLVKMKQIQHTLNEKNILQAIKFPFVVNMECSQKDNSFIYFTMPFIGGGEMFTVLRKHTFFEEELAKFYAGQVVLALEYMHHCSLVYRDLKPENILIDQNGYIKITDFGFCKLITERTFTLCGTPEYLAPEIILTKPYGKSVDWWSFGILVYEMNAGYPPFYSKDPMKIYEKIVAGIFKFGGKMGNDLKDIIKNTLQVDVTKRYGCMKNGTMDIKTHKWFKSLNWEDLMNCKITPTFKPMVSNIGDAENFEKYEEKALTPKSTCLYETEFKDF